MKRGYILLGLYFHIPFCKNKCPYCNFYSVIYNENLKDLYIKAIITEIKNYKISSKTINSIYFGGGTPSLLSAIDIEKIIQSVMSNFKTSPNCEITMELNPDNLTKTDLQEYKKVGINRLSFGVQSFNDEELKILGRTHNGNRTKKIVSAAKDLNFNNISIDLMIGIPNQTDASLIQNLNFAYSLNISHISIYQLKIEPKTKFYRFKPNNLPCDDTVSKWYVMVCRYLKSIGFSQYEISNFAKEKKECIHNLKYWNLEEYLGFGPTAHSFFSNQRFYHNCNLKEYIKNPTKTTKEATNLVFEWFILKMRLKNGLSFEELKEKNFLTDSFLQKLKKLQKEKLVKISNSSFYLSLKGMLLQNSIILFLLEGLK